MPQQVPAAQQFIVWLSETAKAARENAGVNRETVAGLADVNGVTIKRFEGSETRSPPNLDILIAAYARACGIEDGRTLYQDAVDRWMQHSEPLTLERAKALRATVTGPAAKRKPVPDARPKMASERASDVRESGAR